MDRPPRSSRVLEAALKLLFAAIAVQVAVAVIWPLLPRLFWIVAVIVAAGIGLWVWWRWWRSRRW